MSDVYENCPAFENDKFLLRFSQLDDAEDLVSVYSDKNALPFFNSDNCHGDNFYYPNEDRMRQAIKFWLSSYSSKWFVRWTIIDKEKHEAIGTIEVFHRSANDNFNHVGVLRLDLKSEYETSEEIFTIMNLIVPPTFDLFECEEIITKVPVYAVERIEAMKRVGFKKSTKLLVGTMDGYAYKDYWTINRGVYIPLDDLEAKKRRDRSRAQSSPLREHLQILFYGNTKALSFFLLVRYMGDTNNAQGGFYL